MRGRLWVREQVSYGIYDLKENLGWVNVGIDHDTAEFAVELIRRWWKHLGKEIYPNADELFVTADCAGVMEVAIVCGNTVCRSFWTRVV